MQQTTPEDQEGEATNIRPEDVDAYSEYPPRKTWFLDDIYQNCNLALLSVELQSFEEALETRPWRKSMHEELEIIERGTLGNR